MIRRAWSLGLPVALVVGLAFVPRISADIPKVFNGPVNSPGTLQLLATCLVFGGLALTYDLLFGYTGLLSFGHALYFAVGVYLPAIAMTKWEWGFWQSLAITAAFGLALPVVLGAVSLRVTGIAFAMVTLAFAQVGAVVAIKNPHGWTGGEEGFGTDYEKLPDALVGVLNTKHLYWLALGYAAIVFLIIRWAVESSPGRIWQAIRENELRVEVLGLRPHSFKLMAFVLSSFLATAGGTIYLLTSLTGPSPSVTSPNITLTLLIMVVLGGAGTRWGAVLGGVLYKYFENRLGAIGDSSTVHGLPGVLSTPLSEPLFLLGTLFVVLVFFLPGGVARLSLRGRRAGLRRFEQALAARSTPVGGGMEEAT
ncbi:MAG TPA: branched-chain amino acid ABC transporter permease [Gaiellaceae bacterium]|jgi:branched-chain amino acid transport system permease protein